MNDFGNIFEYETQLVSASRRRFFNCQFLQDVENEGAGRYFGKGQWVSEICSFTGQIFAKVYDWDDAYVGKISLTPREKIFEDLPYEKPK